MVAVAGIATFCAAAGAVVRRSHWRGGHGVSRGGRYVVGELRGVLGHLRRCAGVNITRFPLPLRIAIIAVTIQPTLKIKRTLKKGCCFHEILETEVSNIQLGIRLITII